MNQFKSIVLECLEVGQGLIKTLKTELDPQFRIMTPTGDYWLAVTLPPDLAERENIFSLVSDYMAMMSATGFILTSEMKEPDSISALGVKRHALNLGGVEAFGLYSGITRKPVFSFTNPAQIPPDHIGQEIPAILPQGQKQLSERRLKEIDFWFGKEGHYRAVAYADLMKIRPPSYK